MGINKVTGPNSHINPLTQGSNVNMKCTTILIVKMYYNIYCKNIYIRMATLLKTLRIFYSNEMPPYRI